MTRGQRSSAEHARISEELLDLAQVELDKRDEAIPRRGRRARRLENRSLANAAYIVGVAQVHATLATRPETTP